MCSIYLINVGANTNHRSQARSPIFDDSLFVYVSFCGDPNKETNPIKYPPEMFPFTHPDKNNLRTHNDPDWNNMTYGDICTGKGCARGSALRNVKPGDILLFWGLLWHNENANWRECIDRSETCWYNFSRPLDENKGWYLFGAMRIWKIVVDGSTLDKLPQKDRGKIEKVVVRLDKLSLDARRRVKKNTHFEDNIIPTHHWIFLGDKDNKHSMRFDKAVELWIPKTKQGLESKWEDSLLYQTFKPNNGGYLSLSGNTCWYSYLRLCRKMWDFSDSKQRERIKHVRDAIQLLNQDFDLLKDSQWDK